MNKNVSYMGSRMAEVLPPEGELVTDLEKLVHTMGEVAAAASEVELPHFRYGFYGYQQVTKAVTSDLETGFFDYPDKMAETMPQFAGRAFDPIRRYIQGDTDLGDWTPMLRSPLAKKAAASTAMFDFLSFHVLCDLPRTLQDTKTQPKHHQDYSEKINMILTDVGRELMPQYVEVNPVLKRLRVPDIALKIVLSKLFRARDDAWSAFEELQDIQDHPDMIAEIEAYLQSEATNRMLSTKKTANFVINLAANAPAAAWA